MADGKGQVTEEQVLYAKVLNTGMKVGLLGIFATCAVYLTGILEPRLPIADLPNYWGKSVDKLLEATGLHPGWGWLNNAGTGDYINYIPIAILAGVTIVSYLAIVPTLLRNNDKVYAVLALLEVAVLVLAASGILGVGGH